MKNEKEFLNTKIQNLTNEVYKYELEITNMRKDHATRMVTLQTQLAAKTDEVGLLTCLLYTSPSPRD